MSRKLLAVLLSGALWTGIATGPSAAAEPAKPAELSATQTAASPGNQPPLPPGRTINKAQGEEYHDLGPGVIIASIVVATGALFLLMFANNGDDNESTPPATGTN